MPLWAVGTFQQNCDNAEDFLKGEEGEDEEEELIWQSNVTTYIFFSSFSYLCAFQAGMQLPNLFSTVWNETKKTKTTKLFQSNLRRSSSRLVCKLYRHLSNTKQEKKEEEEEEDDNGKGNSQKTLSGAKF